MPLGDSITEGYLPTGGLGGYRVELFSQAVLAGKNITFVGSLTPANAPSTVQNRTFPKKHEGHDGYTIDTGAGTSGISGSITDQAIANYHPSIVLLMIGTNDVNGNIDVANAPTRLGKLIDEITTDSPAALVVVASIIPIASGNNSKAMAYNAAIPGLVSTRAAAGKHVIFVDNYAAFAKDPSYQTSEMSNYLHPNTAGYAILGDSFYERHRRLPTLATLLVAPLLPARRPDGPHAHHHEYEGGHVQPASHWRGVAQPARTARRAVPGLIGSR